MLQLQYACRESWNWGHPQGDLEGPSGVGWTEQVLTAQGLILVLAVGTCADTITDLAGRDAAPPVMAQEACPVHQRHTGLNP